MKVRTSHLGAARQRSALRLTRGGKAFPFVRRHKLSPAHLNIEKKMAPTLPASTAIALGKFLVQWMRGLGRASDERKTECLAAIDAVIIATRKTQAYSRTRDDGRSDPKTEETLAILWTKLGLKLDRLKVKKLAKRCDIKGKYWADPKQFSSEWLAQADVGLESVDKLARQLKARIQVNGAPK